MESILEEQRKLHEERERLEEAMVKEKILKKNSVRERINSEHRQAQLLQRSVDCADQLMNTYSDTDGSREQEVQSLSGPDEFKEFYRRLRRIQEYHSERFGMMDYVEDDPMLVEFVRMDQERQNPPSEMENLVEFTDEEGYGKFLDLHQLHDQFLNLKSSVKLDYLHYLQNFDKLYEIPKEDKGVEYKRYLKSLVDYLSGYLSRIQPLTDQEAIMADVRHHFEEKWFQGTFPGWKKDTGSAMAKHSGAQLDLSAFTSHEELMSLGLDRLKSALMALGLKCGGTLEERAKRLIATKGLNLSQIDKSLFAKSHKSRGDPTERQKEIALIEAQVYQLIELLSEQRASTKDNVERRLARTAEELAEEESDDDIEVVEENVDSDDSDSVPYNPKNLPLGWDGKPIPYWLYKLHGLNITYECEICGGAQYRGPKSFQRHFSEWRHAYGMRCLGIPNTAHFANITVVADARALWEKLRLTKGRDRWHADVEEEYEDSVGNVVNKRTYNDLRRQGLL